MRPVLTENISRQWIVTSFYQGRIYIPDFKNLYTYEKWCRNALATNGTWRELVVSWLLVEYIVETKDL